MPKLAGKARRSEAASAAAGAWWCWMVLKGGVLALLLIKDGDLKAALGMEPWAVAYSFFFFLFFSIGTVLYLALTKSDPGYVDTEEEFTLLEAGTAGAPKPAAGEPTADASSNGIEMQEVELSTENGDNAVSRTDARAKGKGDSETNGNGHAAPEHQNGSPQPAQDGVRARAVPKSDTFSEIQPEVSPDGVGTAYPPSNADSAADQRRCRHCQTTQLLRTKHCYDCGRCVYTFDHHCFWIGNCVGEKNLRLFYCYVLVEFVTVAWACELCLSTFVYANTKAWARDWFVWNLPSMAAFLLCLGFAMLLGSLLFFHTYLILTGQTSWEVWRREAASYMKDVPPEVFPFSQGWRANLDMVFCRSHRQPPRRWAQPSAPWDEKQRFWWIENQYWSCF